MQGQDGDQLSRPGPTTAWPTLPAQAGAEAAFAQLCTAYWSPLYAYIRRAGRSKDDSERLIRDFFLRPLVLARFKGLGAEVRTLRAFLLLSLKTFGLDESRRPRAGEQSPMRAQPGPAFDFEEADRSYRLEARTSRSPVESYERQWAIALLARVLERLRSESTDLTAVEFEALAAFLPGGKPGASFGTVALRLNKTPAAINLIVHALRHRYGVILRSEVRATLNHASDVDKEIQHLYGVLRG